MTTPYHQLKQKYRDYMKTYGSMLQDLADSEETIQNMIHRSDHDIGLILSAVRCTIEQTLDDNYAITMEGCPVMQLHKSPQKAVIYCRSAIHQEAEDNAFDLQKQRCQDFAAFKGYTVTDCFYDEGVSGNSIDRPSLQKMLQFLKSADEEHYIVLVDEISRLARSVQTHVQITNAIHEAGATLESPTLTCDNTPESQFISNMRAAIAERDA